MIFVFLALVEYALVNSYMRRSEKYERLANKYKRKSSTDILTLSPMFASELARSYAEMMKLRRKSSAMNLIEDVKRSQLNLKIFKYIFPHKDFTSSPRQNRRKLAKGSREETSLSLSEDTTEQSSKHSNSNSKNSTDGAEKPLISQVSNSPKTMDQKKNPSHRNVPGMDGSYYGVFCRNPESFEFLQITCICTCLQPLNVWSKCPMAR